MYVQYNGSEWDRLLQSLALMGSTVSMCKHGLMCFIDMYIDSICIFKYAFRFHFLWPPSSYSSWTHIINRYELLYLIVFPKCCISKIYSSIILTATNWLFSSLMISPTRTFIHFSLCNLWRNVIQINLLLCFLYPDWYLNAIIKVRTLMLLYLNCLNQFRPPVQQADPQHAVIMQFKIV